MVPSVPLSLLRGEAPKLSSGRFRADWIYISDVVDALLLAASAPSIEGRTIDIDTGTLVSIRDIVERPVLATGAKITPLFKALAEQPGENERKANILAASELLGWRAKANLDKGLYETVRWFRTNGEKS